LEYLPNGCGLWLIDFQGPFGGVIAQRQHAPIHIPLAWEAVILSRIRSRALTLELSEEQQHIEG